MAKKKIKKKPATTRKVVSVSTKKPKVEKPKVEKPKVEKPKNIEVCFSGSTMAGQNRVDYKLCKDPHFVLELTTFKIEIKEVTTIEKKPVDVEITYLELVREKEETDQNFYKRSRNFEAIQNQRSRGVAIEIPKEFKTQERQGRVKQIKDVEVIKKMPTEKKMETERIDLYFQPFDHQIIELISNYLKS